MKVMRRAVFDIGLAEGISRVNRLRVETGLDRFGKEIIKDLVLHI